MNFRMIKNVIGWILLFEAFFLAVPIITAIVYGEDAILAFTLTALICLTCGALLTLGKPKTRTLYSREGFIIVALSWIVLSVFGALPFLFSGAMTSFTDALFETVSGFTTTGASILTDVEILPKSVLIWRSFTHWIGGMGVLVFIMAFLPLSGGQNLHIMKAESPGPSVNKLVPKVRTTAMILYTLYLILTLLELLTLVIGGMNFFEALNISFATAGTGGFSVKNSSLAGYSPFLQVAVSMFMLLFSLNFNSYYLLIKGRFRQSFKQEIRVFFLIVFAAVAVITINVYFSNLAFTFEESARHSLFAVSSVISTTGFVTADFNLWPELSRTVIVLLMFIGACAGSTGGGIKVSRIIILVKGTARELGNMLHTKQIKKIIIDKRPVDDEIVTSVNSYFVCYIMIFVISLIAVSINNHDLVTSFTAVSATLNNVGPGLGGVGPVSNYSFFSNPAKYVLIFDMLAGRLELFPILLLLSPKSWRKC